MDITDVLTTIKPVPTTTKLKAWVFEIDKSYYHVAECTGYRMPDQTFIWTSSRNGKRTSKDPVYTMDGASHKQCIIEFYKSKFNLVS